MNIGVDWLHLIDILGHQLPLVVLQIILRLLCSLFIKLLHHLTLLVHSVFILTCHCNCTIRTLHLSLKTCCNSLLVTCRVYTTLLLWLLQLLLLNTNCLLFHGWHVHLLLLILFQLVLGCNLWLLLTCSWSKSLWLLDHILLLHLTLVLRSRLHDWLLIWLGRLNNGLLLIGSSLHLQNLSQSLLVLRRLTLSIIQLWLILRLLLLLLLRLNSIACSVQRLGQHLLGLTWLLLLLLLQK